MGAPAVCSPCGRKIESVTVPKTRVGEGFDADEALWLAGVGEDPVPVVAHPCGHELHGTVVVRLHKAEHDGD